MSPTWGALGHPFPLPGASLTSQSWGCSAQASPSLCSVPPTCTNWTVTTAIMNRYDGVGLLPLGAPGSAQFVASPLTTQCASPFCLLQSLRAAATEVAAKPGTGSARPCGATVGLARGRRGDSGEPRIKSLKRGQVLAKYALHQMCGSPGSQGPSRTGGQP